MTYFSSKGEAYGIQIRSTLIGFGNGFQASPPHRMLSKALELSNKTAFNFADRATSSQTKFIPRFSRQYVMASLDIRIIYGVFRAAKNNQTPPSGSCLAREDDGTCLAGVPEFHLELPKKQHSSERLFLLANPKKIDEIPMINFC
ncbi:hypothetical protein ACFE04_026484 [Oxalis oulophora]